MVKSMESEARAVKEWEYAEKIGADAAARDAVECVKVCAPKNG